MAETNVIQHQPPVGGFMYALRYIPPQRLFGLLCGFAVIIALLAGVYMWSKDPGYKLLYSNLSDRDGGAVVQALQQMNVPYKFSDGGGVIYVPGDQVHDVRLRLASQGLPRGGTVGFELLENQKFGLTQFQEQVNYQRALEGELSRSVQALSAVQAARVHLAIPKPSVFLRQQQKPSASVLLTLYPGRTLDREQIAGIAHLVSSSVPELPVSAVSVIDQSGTLLSADMGGSKSGAQLDEQQLAYIHQIEASYIKRIVDILEPIVGRDNVRAQVTADLDFSESEATDEIYKPNQNPAQAAIRSQQTHESINGSQTAGGVPGALSNQPAPPATAPITGGPQGATANATQANVNTRREATTNYEIDKTVRHTRTPTGTIKRLSAAVVVNYRKEAGAAAAKGKGKAEEKLAALSAEEMEKIQALVKEAIGYTQTRGDSLNIANVPFTEPKVEVVPEPPLWKQPQNIELAKGLGKNLLIGGLVLFILFAFVRPLIKAAKSAVPVMPMPAQLPDYHAAPGNYEDRLKATRDLARNDPKMVASVVRNWVQDE